MDQMRSLDRRLAAKRDALSQLQGAIDPDAEMHERKRLWRLEDEVREFTLTHMDMFEQIEAALQQALAICPKADEARELLAGLYLEQSRLTFSSRIDVLPRYYRRLVSRVDPDGVAASLSAPGRLLVRGAFDTGHIHALEEKDRRLVPAADGVAFASGAVISLAPGRYLVRMTIDSHKTIRTTCQVVAGETNVILLGKLRPPPDNTFVYIPGGPTLCGGDPLAHHTLQARTEYVGPFFASTYSVTFGEYSTFLSDLYKLDRERALQHVPRTSGGGMLCDLKPGQGYEPGLRILASANHKHYVPGSGAEWMVPVFGISLHDAQAYIKWRTAREGIPYRLLTEWEWERLVRGGDGRHYPWGESFDPSFCLTQSTHREGAWPEPAGVYPLDVSPFGVHDLAGGVQTWTQTHDAHGWVVKGGAWSLGPVFSRAASRRMISADAHLPEIGLLLAVDITY